MKIFQPRKLEEMLSSAQDRLKVLKRLKAPKKIIKGEEDNIRELKEYIKAEKN